jgi:hypothetical protein
MFCCAQALWPHCSRSWSKFKFELVCTGDKGGRIALDRPVMSASEPDHVGSVASE